MSVTFDGTQLVIADGSSDELWTLASSDRFGDADPINVGMVLSEATGTRTAAGEQTGDAEPLDMGMGLSEATGVATPASTVTINTVPPKDGEVARFLVTIGADSGTPQRWLDQRTGQNVGTISGDYEISSTIEINRIRFDTGSPERIRFGRNGSGSFSQVASLNPALQWYIGTETQVHNLDTQQSVGTGTWAWTVDAAALDAETSTGSVVNLVCGIEPSGPARTGDAEPIDMGMGLSEATGTRTPPGERTGSASPIGMGMGLSEATGTTATPPPPPPPAPVVVPVTPPAPGEISRGLHLRVETRAYTVDTQGRVIDDITDRTILDGGKISRDSCAMIPGGARFVVEGTLLWPSTRIRLTTTLTDLVTGRSVTADQGVYIPTTPGRVVGPQTRDLWQVTAYDLLYLLDQPLDRTWQVLDGDDLAAGLQNVVDAAAVGLVLRLAPVAGTIRGSRIWPLDEEWTWLGIANDLLRSASWNDLYTLGDGTVTSEPWQPARQLSPVLHVDSTDSRTVLAETATLQADTWGVPNRWVVVDPNLAAEGEWPVPGAGVAVVTNQSDGPSSVDQRGYVRIRRVETEADSQAALQLIAERISISDRRPTEQICTTVAPLVELWHGDVIELTDPTVGLFRAPMLVRSWERPLPGGDMKLDLERP